MDKLSSVKIASISAGLLLSCMFLFSGCYTKFATLQDNIEPNPEPNAVSDTCSTCDSVARANKGRVDTVVIRDGRREVCYWTRNFWGEPVLRCTETLQGYGWTTQSQRPWWSSLYSYDYDFGQCPGGYYFDPSCGRCRNYYQGRWYYPSINRVPTTVIPSPSSSVQRSRKRVSVDAPTITETGVSSTINSAPAAPQSTSPSQSVAPSHLQRRGSLEPSTTIVVPTKPQPPPPTTTVEKSEQSAPPTTSNKVTDEAISSDTAKTGLRSTGRRRINVE